MNIALFNKKYIVRRFGKQREVKGYLYSDQHDFVASLNVHPTGQDVIQALPEGQRQIKRLEGHGGIELLAADEKTQIKGDLLYYHGDWYECVSCQLWDHTILSHYNYQFVIVPPDAGGATDRKPPTITPEQDGGNLI